MKLKCSSDLRWNSHCGHGRKTILNYGIYIVLQFLYHIESIYNILVTSYDKNFAFEVLLEKIKEFGAEILSQTELKEKFITCEDYEKVRIYIKPKENKDEESKNSKSLDELLNEDENLYEEYYDEIEAALDWVFEGLSLWLK